MVKIADSSHRQEWRSAECRIPSSMAEAREPDQFLCTAGMAAPLPQKKCGAGEVGNDMIVSLWNPLSCEFQSELACSEFLDAGIKFGSPGVYTDFTLQPTQGQAPWMRQFRQNSAGGRKRPARQLPENFLRMWPTTHPKNYVEPSG